MDLGAFSVSLAVKDLETSRKFYENLGFEVFGGQADQNWLIMKNREHLIGLFQGMFENNILTFNPGWDQNAADTENMTDIRSIQAELKKRGIALDAEVEADSTGPASVMLTDPDGNQILIDQHR